LFSDPPLTDTKLMKSGCRSIRHLSLCALALSIATGAESLPAASAEGKVGIAATVNPIATDAAIAAMKHGGNAIDGAIAAALTLGVVDGYNSGIGGGCFLLIRLANGNVVAIDGRETAPSNATRNMFGRAGKADPQLAQTGPLAVAVPGALAGYDLAIRKFGKLSLEQHLRDSAAIAERGFNLDQSYANRIADAAGDLRRFEASRKIFFRSDGSGHATGDLFVQKDLARTYREIAEKGIEWFYRGPFASRTGEWMKQNGGILSGTDFAEYQAKFREPVTNTYRGYTVIGFPPPSSGGVHVAQILNILEHFELGKMNPNSADFVHVVAEAMKIAFADRAFWLGDPDFAPVPRGLVSKEYAARLATRIKMDRATSIESHDLPDEASSNTFGKHTTHFCTADQAGNWVACTATINTTFGSKVVVPGTGVVLDNEMDDFAIEPGVANYFGLVGAEANSIAPRKRPLSSMSPTIVLKKGKPIFSVGAAGGPTIISQAILAIIYAIDFGMPIEAALAQPRFHHQWRPDELKIERKFGASVLKELERRGHRIVPVDALGVAQAMSLDLTSEKFHGVSDPRLAGKAAGF